MRVRDVMTPEPLVLDADLPVRTAALLLFNYEVAGAPVVDGDGTLVGVVSEADLLGKEVTPPHGWGRRGIQAERRWHALTVGEICSRPAITVEEQLPLHEAARLLQRRDIARLVVVDRDRIVGIVTRHDVLKALIRTDVALNEAVEAVLAVKGEPEVRASVESGVIRLEGAVSKRSCRDELICAVRQIDGVMAVDADRLTWLDDDVIPIPQ